MSAPVTGAVADFVAGDVPIEHAIAERAALHVLDTLASIVAACARLTELDLAADLVSMIAG